MESRRFDQLARVVSGAGSRRGVLQLVAVLPVLTWLTGAPDAEAKACKRKCRKKKNNGARRRCRKRCRTRQQTPPECEASADCAPGEVCEDGECLPGPDHCTGAEDCDDCEACDNGACVATCEADEVCQNGACCQPLAACPGGRNCGVMDDGCGGLLRCGPDTCADGHYCFDNRCFCPDGYAVCKNICCDVDEVCANGNGACCTPSCDGKACGADDGCGGVCQEGSCPVCQFCLDGTCQQEFPGTPCGGANAEVVCLFDGSCGVFTCEDGNDDDCPGDCRCATFTFSNLCYEGTERGCPGAESCADDFQCPPGFQCTPCPGPIGSRCIPLCSG